MVFVEPTNPDMEDLRPLTEALAGQEPDLLYFPVYPPQTGRIPEQSAELGLDRDNPQISKAVERYLSLQENDGDFYGHFSCLLGYNIRTFLMLGYCKDARVQNSIDLLLSTEREDGGYLCDMHEGKYKTKSVKSCVRGSVKALLAFSNLPEYWDARKQSSISRSSYHYYYPSRGNIHTR